MSVAISAVSIPVPHAIVFVLDPGHPDPIVPEFVPGEPVAANATCISVATLPEVDGEVAIRIGDDPASPELEEVFAGVVETPGRRLAVLTSDGRVVLETAVSEDVSRMMIAVDDPRAPGILEVTVFTRPGARLE